MIDKRVVAITKEEAEEDNVFLFGILLFIIGISGVAFLMHTFIIPSDWNNTLRVSLMLVPGAILGGVLAYFSKLIMNTLLFLFFLAFIGLIIALIISIIVGR